MGSLASTWGHVLAGCPSRWGGYLSERKPAGREEHPESAQAIRSLSRIWPGLLLPVPVVTSVWEQAGTWRVPRGCHVCCRGDSTACDKLVSLALGSEAAASQDSLPFLGTSQATRSRLPGAWLGQGSDGSQHPCTRSCCVLSSLERGGGDAPTPLIAAGSCSGHRSPIPPCSPASRQPCHRVCHSSVTVCVTALTPA